MAASLVAENAKNGGGKLSMVWLSLLTENGEVFSSISSINRGIVRAEILHYVIKSMGALSGLSWEVFFPHSNLYFLSNE